MFGLLLARRSPQLSGQLLVRPSPVKAASQALSAHPQRNINDGDLYSVLGVGHSATQAEIRTAFLHKVKRLHPDTREAAASRQGRPPNGAEAGPQMSFVSLMSAYEVLRNPQRRHHYDQLHAVGSRGSDAEASRGFAPGGTYEHTMDEAEAEADRWLQWLYSCLGGERSLQTALVKRHHGASLRAALLEAYLGPWVDANQGLPACFEGEERNAHLTGVNDLLHLVSGRQLLGTVRVAGRHQLADHSTCQPLHLQSPRHHGGLLGSDAHHAGCSGIEPSRGTWHALSSAAVVAGRRQQEPKAETVPTPDGGARGPGATRHQADSPLELLLGTETVARSVRSPAGTALAEAVRIHGGQALPVLCDPDGRLQHDLVSVWVLPEHSAESEDPGKMHLAAHVVGLRDKLLHLEEGPSRPWIAAVAGKRFSHATVFTAQGQLTHTLVAHRTLGVRSLAWTQGKLGWVECRSARAWMPPPEYWLFKPRVETHSSGGWYFERYTDDSVYTPRRQRGRLGPLLPAPVHVLTAAYDSLDWEGSGSQSDPWQESESGGPRGSVVSGDWWRRFSQLWDSTVLGRLRR